MVTRLFKSLIGKSMAAYVDDMLVKSKEEEEHVKDLTDCFSIMRKYNLRLNAKKYAFAVRGGKFLGYMVTRHGIEPNPEKVNSCLLPIWNKEAPGFFQARRRQRWIEWITLCCLIMLFH